MHCVIGFASQKSVGFRLAMLARLPEQQRRRALGGALGDRGVEHVFVKLCGRTQPFVVFFLAMMGFVQTGWAQAASSAAPAVPEAPPTPVVSENYVIGPGDVLTVFVWRNPELTVSVPVRPDGRITTPLAEAVTASGKTAEELAREIEKVLAEYVRSPQVNVIVTTPRGIISEVKAVGQVKTPMGVAYRDGMTVLDLVLAVGGLTDFAAGNRAKIVRQQDGKPVDIRVKLNSILEGGDMSRNIPLRPGDVLVVPEARF
jgi:polysaccharide biosynthesis/export protein